MTWITTKLLGYVSGGLLIALLAASAFGWLQTSRLSTAHASITTRDGQIVLLRQRVTDDAGKIVSRDKLIGAQNLAVLAMQRAADADRTAYLARIQAADKVAQVYQNQAADIMARQIDTTVDLTRSRAALALITEMIGTRP